MFWKRSEITCGGRLNVAEYGEWNRKGASLSDETAKKEYGVSREFIIKGIRAERIEFRDAAIWGNPYIRVLRSQLEKYIAEEMGHGYLADVKAKEELRLVKRELASLKRRLGELENRKSEIEKLFENK